LRYLKNISKKYRKNEAERPLNQNAKPAEKPFKLNDGKGLYLYINTGGGKLWRFDFSYNGKQKTLSIGKYPTVSLVEAR